MNLKIGLIDLDKKMPNIALMKISNYHKQEDDVVEWYFPLAHDSYDKIYASSVFTFSDKSILPNNVICGGSGFDLKTILPANIENQKLDYSIYPEFKQAMGFLTRGCIRNCEFCFVPEKEGQLRPYKDIEEVLQGRTEALLLDNNILASDYGIKQIEKIIKLKVKVDFNQGLDARLIDDSIARLLSKVKWLSPLRLACDHDSQIPSIQKAVKLLRWYNCRPSKYMVYALIKDIENSMERIKTLKGLYLDVFAMPYIDKNGVCVDIKTKYFARFINHRAVFNSVLWEDYKDNN